jgi:ketosteroid isomerase-like protein
MNRDQLRDWLAAYERAWRAPGTEALAEIFAPDATYRTAPFEDAYRGLDAIAELWEREREGPDEAFEMRSEVVAVEGDTGVARVEVRYGDPVVREYRDLWIIRLDASGRCLEFDEWPFWPADAEGSFAPGPS